MCHLKEIENGFQNILFTFGSTEPRLRANLFCWYAQSGSERTSFSGSTVNHPPKSKGSDIIRALCGVLWKWNKSAKMKEKCAKPNSTSSEPITARPHAGHPTRLDV